jgi:hypothetical protein
MGLIMDASKERIHRQGDRGQSRRHPAMDYSKFRATTWGVAPNWPIVTIHATSRPIDLMDVGQINRVTFHLDRHLKGFRLDGGPTTACSHRKVQSSQSLRCTTVTTVHALIAKMAASSPCVGCLLAFLCTGYYWRFDECICLCGNPQ